MTGKCGSVHTSNGNYTAAYTKCWTDYFNQPDHIPQQTSCFMTAPPGQNPQTYCMGILYPGDAAEKALYEKRKALRAEQQALHAQQVLQQSLNTATTPTVPTVPNWTADITGNSNPVIPASTPSPGNFTTSSGSSSSIYLIGGIAAVCAVGVFIYIRR